MTLAIVASVGMLVLGIVAKALTGDWLHPSAIFCGFWGSVCCIAILIAPEDILSASGPLWIFLNTAIVFAGGMFGGALACSSYSRRRTRAFKCTGDVQLWSANELRTLTISCTILGLIYALLLVRSQGVDPSQLLTFQGLAKAAVVTSFTRYSTNYQSGSLSLQLLLTVSYVAPLLGGTLFTRRSRSVDTALSFISMAPSFVAFCTQSTKSSFVFGAVMWAAGFMSSREYFGLSVRQIHRRALYIVAATIPMLMLMISIGSALRTGGGTAETIGQSVLGDRTKTYMCGHIGALSLWLDSTDLEHIQPALGRFSVAGPYEALHFGNRLGGITADNAILPTGVTNVYTYFRQLAEDLSVSGALIAMGALAILWGFAYRRAREHARFWTGVLATCYCAALLVLTSMFNYNSMILAVILYGIWWCRPWRALRGSVWAQ